MPDIKLENVSVKYKVKKRQFIKATDNVNCVFKNGKISVIIGESGCGKTSILRSIVGLINDYDGDIYFDEFKIKDFTIQSRNVAYVSQMIGLYPHMTAFNNIAFPLKVSNCSEEEIRRRVKEVADLLHITHCLARKPKQLSIGQCQRVAIARALVKRAIVYVFDEPFSNLDKELSRELTMELKKIFSTLNSTVLFVSHDVSEALTIADEVFVMHNGKIIEHDDPRKIIYSKNEIVKGFFKEL